MTESETDLARRLLKEVLDGTNKWTPDMRLRIATVSQAYASLAIVDELKRMNDRQDALHPPCSRSNVFALPGNGVVNEKDVRECALPSGHAGYHRAGDERWAQ